VIFATIVPYMTQPSDHPEERQSSEGVPPPPPSQQPYPSAPPISEPYGAAPGPGGVEYGSRWSRLLAAIIDGLITGAIGWVLVLPFFGAGAMFDSGTKHLGARVGANLVTTVIAVIYYTVQHGKWGQTIGKRALNIRVVRAADGGPISYGQAAGRSLFTYLISIVTCGIGAIVDAAWILGDQRRQALHDKVVGSVVLRADGPDPYAGR
jgi:uncharacterized RDD family membrane protein YckC